MELKTRALRLAELIPRARLHPRAVAYLDARAKEPSRWLVAFSGGADSLALLLLVWAHWPERRDRLIGAHFNHALRGAESDADETSCIEILNTLGAPAVVERWTEAREGTSEELARAARLEFLQRTARDRSADVILTGHHADDVIETQLMRLGRGASSAGLAAPRPVRASGEALAFVRPLLNISKAVLIDALRETGAEWREDSTNATCKFTRNRVRAEVAPAWQRALGPNALTGALLSREWLEEDDAALEQWLNELAVIDPDGGLRLEKLRHRPNALWRRALHRWLAGRELSRAGFEQLIELARRGDGALSVGDGWATARDGVLSWRDREEKIHPWPTVHVDQHAETFFPDGALLRVQRVEVDAELRSRLCSGNVDTSTNAFVRWSETGWFVRPRQPGDRYRPLGAPGPAKLQDALVNAKIPREWRDILPLICTPDGRIVWVPGLPPSEDAKIAPDTVHAAKLTYTPGTYTVYRKSYLPNNA